MIHFYPRNPYKYAACGYIPKDDSRNMTKTQKVFVSLWLVACFLIILVKAYLRFF